MKARRFPRVFTGRICARCVGNQKKKAPNEGREQGPRPNPAFFTAENLRSAALPADFLCGPRRAKRERGRKVGGSEHIDRKVAPLCCSAIVVTALFCVSLPPPVLPLNHSSEAQFILSSNFVLISSCSSPALHRVSLTYGTRLQLVEGLRTVKHHITII